MRKFYAIFCLFLRFPVTVCAMESSQAQGLIVIPGLGRADRLNNVVSNLELLKSFIKVRNSIHWDCVVYAYASRLDHDFWNMESQLGRLRTYCNIIENPRGKVTENMYLAQPALIRSHYELVFLLLDDIKLLAYMRYCDNEQVLL